MLVATPQHNNRVLEAIKYYLQQEHALYANRDIIGPIAQKNDMLKLQYYQQLLVTFKKDLTKDEKAARIYLQTEVKRLKYQTDKTLPSLLLNNPVSRWLVLWLDEKLDQFKMIDDFVARFTKDAAIDSSIVLLNKQLQQAGFAKNMDPQLRKMMDMGIDKFHLHYFDLQNPETDYVLHFSKIQGTSNYRFHAFEAAAVPGWMNPNSKADYIHFDLQQYPGLSASQAGTLLNGRAIAVDNSDQHWMVYDKTAVDDPLKIVSFDLTSALKDFPLPSMDDGERSHLIQVLRAGGEKELTYSIDNTSVVYKLQAYPYSNSLILRDQQNQYVNPSGIASKTPSTTEIIMNHSQKQQQEYIPRLSRV